MPPVVLVVAAIAASYAATAGVVAFAAAAGIFLTTTASAILLSGFMIGFGYAASAITGAISGKPRQADRQSLSDAARGMTAMVRSSVEPHRIVYGQRMLSGPLLFVASTGASNEYLHLVVALAGHECEEIGDVYFDDTISTDSRFTGLVRITKHLGADDQTADADLVAEVTEWTAAHRLRGIAYLYVRLKWSASVWLNGVPNIKAVVKGRKVYDPRTGLTAWSQNAALCQRDYLRASFGIVATAAEVDDTIAGAAANICDEDVALDGGGTQKRYTCDGGFTLDQRPIDIMDDLLTSSAGTMVYSQGTYKIHAGAYATPTVTLTADDLRGPLEIVSRPSRREAYNLVRGTFVDAANYYQPTDFPPQSSATYAAEDGATLPRDIELPYTTNLIRAQRIAKLHLHRGREGMIVKFPARLSAMGRTAWETVYLTIAQAEFSAEVFRILEWALAEDGGIDLTLQKESASVYGWLAEESIPAAVPEVTLLSPEDRQATITNDDVVAGTFSPLDHSTQHENGGSDEISVAGLSGVLADAQTPAAHGNEAHSAAYVPEAPADGKYYARKDSGWVEFTP